MGLQPVWTMLGFFLSLAGAVASVGVAALLLRSQELGRNDQRAPAVALGVSAAWCVAVAAHGADGLTAQLLEPARNLAWIVVLYRMFGYDGRDHSLGPVRPLVGVLVCVELLQPLLLITEIRLGATDDLHALVASVSALLRTLVAVGALLLLHNLYAGASPSSRQVLRWPAGAMVAVWGFQLNIYGVAWLLDGASPGLVALRGLEPLAAAALCAIGTMTRAADLRIAPSRTVAFQSLSLLVIGGYLMALVAIGRSLSALGDGSGRLAQVAFLAFAVIAALAWLPSKRARGWLRVSIVKHFFRHRYDYRAEWLRFTGTIGRTGAGARPLPERAAQAMADITDSQGGALLLVGDDGALELAGRWQWRDLYVPGMAATPELLTYFEREGRIIELDAIRAGKPGPGEAHAVPQWLIDTARAWVVVPLLHFDRLVGVALLARPPVARALDWEDFDLLKIVGRQLASYVAEQSGHAALAEATRFDEFNRRIAFVMHDIKNLASQMSLLARNAEKHAENPAFRKDMLVTLTNSADKLNALLRRLGRYSPAGNATREPFDLAMLARRVAQGFGDPAAVRVVADRACMVVGDKEALEQALVHLVQNALDASEQGQPVHMNVKGEALAGHVEIVDSGAGMSPQFVREGLFKPFVSSKDGGFGIGAFEARELVRAMGGRLDVDSREGIGSRFTVTLPLSASAGSHSWPEPVKDVA